MQRAASMFKVLADPTRLRLAALLLFNGETCVCDLAHALNEPDFKISRHLGVMRAAGMVSAKRNGTWMHYRMADPGSEFERYLQNFLRTALADQTTVLKDVERVSTTSCR